MASTTEIDNLNRRFAIPGIAEILAGENSLPKIKITGSAASAEIYLHGAQITSWHPVDSSEVIFLSEHSHWQDGKAIRGGIPICFPWFRAKSDNAAAPSHGVVRTKTWELEAVSEKGEAVIVTLSTESDAESRKWWPYDFRLTHKITVDKALIMELTTSNTGSEGFKIEEALHTYNRVSDVKQVSITGLDKTSFLDNRDGNDLKVQQGDIALTRDTDNAYINTGAPVEIADPVLQRRIRLEKQNSATTIIWNPWKDDAAKLADLGDDEWTQFACVEASNILSAAVTVAPGQKHTMTAIIKVTS
jgi:glucose-6-phosphate 1-epimerase